MDEGKGPPMICRDHLSLDPATRKLVVWVQKRRWLFFWKDWYLVDGVRRYAMKRFIDLIEEAEVMLRLAEEHKDDNEIAVKNLEDTRKGKGIPYRSPRVPRQDAIEDMTKEFDKLRQQFRLGVKTGRGKLGTPDHATVSKYVPDTILPHLRVEGKEFDHTIGYDPSRNRSQQNQGKRNRGKQQGKRMILQEQDDPQGQ